MKLGTTPTHIFELPCDINALTDVKIVYHQNGEQILRKRLRNCEVNTETNTLSLTLTQEETFMFQPNLSVEIQLRAITGGGDVLASDIYKVPASRCLDSEVLI